MLKIPKTIVINTGPLIAIIAGLGDLKECLFWQSYL